VVQKNNTIYTIDTDHLNTPRQLKDASGKVVWNWNSANFGNLKPNEDPDGDGNKVTFNLRYPGQYYDKETGLHYNYFRDYNPATGRYVQSDPIGLAGGINTYAYVGGNPLSFSDPMGLNPLVGCLAGSWAGPVGCGAGAGIATAITGGLALATIMSIPGDTSKTEQCPPGDKDPCKGLRDQLNDHERKLREYMINPMSMDNKGFLAGALAKNDQDLYAGIYLSRVASLQKQIANFKKQLEECERRNGR
jgi:RHS repeat-associated protein